MGLKAVKSKNGTIEYVWEDDVPPDTIPDVQDVPIEDQIKDIKEVVNNVSEVVNGVSTDLMQFMEFFIMLNGL